MMKPTVAMFSKTEDTSVVPNKEAWQIATCALIARRILIVETLQRDGDWSEANEVPQQKI